MFTGIIESTARVESLAPAADAIRLVVRSTLPARGLKTGASVAVNGCCLTVAKTGGRGPARRLQFDLLAETFRLTNFRHLRPGDPVNLERAVRAGAGMDGHFVTGHIDGVGKIIRWVKSGRDHVLDIAAPPPILRHIVLKGSVAVDGISLTVAAVRAKSFRVWIIPHTRSATNLQRRRTGDEVNLETDLLGKYVERFLAATANRRANFYAEQSK
jgi:riboflavin synthase